MPILRFKQVDPRNWHDLEKLFESKGCPHYCWCMVWRKMIEGTSRSDKADKKASLKNYVDNQNPVGILCYENKEPVSWCSIVPRESYRELSGDHSLSNVWSLVCFFIKRTYRQKGIMEELIQQAINYAKSNGAKYVEAYPVEPESPCYRFMGFVNTFEKAGFHFVKKAGTRRNVMLYKI